MGADYEGQEKAIQEKAIQELNGLSDETKGVLCHHLGNSLQAVLSEAQTHGLTLSEKCVHHMLDDLEMFGIRKKYKF